MEDIEPLDDKAFMYMMTRGYERAWQTQRNLFADEIYPGTMGYTRAIQAILHQACKKGSIAQCFTALALLNEEVDAMDANTEYYPQRGGEPAEDEDGS